MLEAKIKTLEDSLIKMSFLKAEVKLNESFLKMLFDTIPNPIFYKDKEGIYRNCNDAFSKNILGIPKEDIIGKSLYDFPEEIPTENADIYSKMDRELVDKKGVQFYSSNVKCTDNVIRHYNFYKATFLSDDDEALGIVGVMLDITNLQKQEEELRLLVSIDPLTKLFNRRYLIKTGEVLFNLAQRDNSNFFALILDIDKFKNINDTYGHKVGDDVLVSLSNKLQEVVRKSDVVSRWGGEEFVILLPNTDEDGAFLIAEKIRKEAEKLSINIDNNKEVKFTVSIGIAQFNKEDINLESLIGRSDIALYKAKNSGRNRVCINNPRYMKILLDKDATIIEFECTLLDIKYDFSDLMGKNWFETFINEHDKEKILQIFNELLNNKNEKWKTYKNDIRCADGSHKFIDFTNEVILRDGNKFISSFGVEYIDKI